MMEIGERIRIYNCCSKTTSEGEGCVRGPHVFYESKPEELHSRHAFSHTRPYMGDTADTALDVVAIDCEMIYTTAGMSVARVSVVDGSGKEMYDQIVRLDDCVQVM
jgi:RNA exonuclease 1